MATSQATSPTSHIAPMITQETARASEVAAREHRSMAKSPMDLAHTRIFGAILRGVEEYGDNVIKVPFWQLLHAHTHIGGFDPKTNEQVRGGGVRINTEVEWTRRDCPHALRLAFDSALTDQCRLFPIIGSAIVRKVPDHLWTVATQHRSTYGRYSLGAVAVKNGQAHPEDRPILGVILFDDVGRIMLAEGNISAVVARVPVSDFIKDLTATHMFSRLPFFVKNKDEQTQFLVTEYYKMSCQLDVLNTRMGFSLGQSWNSFSVDTYVPAPVEQVPAAKAVVAEPIVEQPVAKAPVVEQPVVKAQAPAVEPVAELASPSPVEAESDEEDFDTTGLPSSHERGATEMPVVSAPAAPVAAAPAPTATSVAVEVEVDDLFAELTPEQEFERAKRSLQSRLKIAMTTIATCTRELAAATGGPAMVFIRRLEDATKEVNDIKTEAAALKAQYGKKA